MRTIRTKVYSFDELNKQARENAIKQIRNNYYLDNDFAEWAIDDCVLFEPSEKELFDILGTDYNFPLIKNNRKNIYFATDRNYFLDCAIAMEVTNEEQFLKWLDIDRNIDGLGDITFTIFTNAYKNSSTTIDFDNYSSAYDDLILLAQKKFNKHIKECLKRIENDINYRFTDEAIIEDILANDYEFLSNGTIF